MNLEICGTGSKGNCYLLRNKDEVLIIELGVRLEVVKRALSYDLSKVVGCIVTHEHNDHSKYVPSAAASGLNIYATRGTFEAKKLSGHRYNVVEKGKVFKIGGFKILPFEVKHDVKEPVGFIIQHSETGNILFITDTYYVPNRFENIHNIIIEANYCEKIIDEKSSSDKKFLRDRVIQSHMSLQTCKEFLSANDLSKVNNIVLIHLSDSNSDAKLFKKEISDRTGKTVTVAENGMIINLDISPF